MSSDGNLVLVRAKFPYLGQANGPRTHLTHLRLEVPAWRDPRLSAFNLLGSGIPRFSFNIVDAIF